MPEDALWHVLRHTTGARYHDGGEPGVRLACAGIDPARWASVEFAMGSSDESLASGALEATTYTVLHVSQPA